MKNSLDKFYTQDLIALKMCQKLREILGDFDILGYEFLEPSAGGGAFLRGLEIVFKNPKITAIDIAPFGENLGENSQKISKENPSKIHSPNSQNLSDFSPKIYAKNSENFTKTAPKILQNLGDFWPKISPENLSQSSYKNSPKTKTQNSQKISPEFLAKNSQNFSDFSLQNSPENSQNLGDFWPEISPKNPCENPQNSCKNSPQNAKTPHIIKKADFLKFTPKAKKIITIGNPPFGVRSKMAVNFFNHAAIFSDIIAFIVPLQFQKYSVQKQLNADFGLAFCEILPPNSFILENKEYAVRCCFQIWARLDLNEFWQNSQEISAQNLPKNSPKTTPQNSQNSTNSKISKTKNPPQNFKNSQKSKTLPLNETTQNFSQNSPKIPRQNLRLLAPPPVNHADFDAWQYNNTPGARKYFDKAAFGWDFAAVRQGFYDYSRLIFDENELNPKIQYIFFKAKNRAVLRRLKRINFAKLSLKNTTTPGFGKADVVAEYERIKNGESK